MEKHSFTSNITVEVDKWYQSLFSKLFAIVFLQLKFDEPISKGDFSILKQNLNIMNGWEYPQTSIWS